MCKQTFATINVINVNLCVNVILSDNENVDKVKSSF